MKRIKKTVKDLQKFWFLITVVFSAVIALFYMLVFQVKPWDSYAQIKQSREQEAFHCKISYKLLEKGHYEKARKEFEKALSINPNNFKALNGQYFSNLFIELKSPDWDPAVGLEVQSHLNDLGIVKNENLEHIVEKYLGDLHYKINETESAKLHFEKALQLKPDYIDALFSYGWFNYSELNDADKMMVCFDRLIEADPYDYRGYHGSGYGLYMKALSSNIHSVRIKNQQEALQRSKRASTLTINYLNVVMDFGEISRSLDPQMALRYHKWALRILEDHDLYNLELNSGPLGINLLMTYPGVSITLNDIETKKSWIYYQIALDYYSMHRNGLLEIDSYKEKFEEYVSKAKSLDKKRIAVLVYDDQKKILDYLIDKPIE